MKLTPSEKRMIKRFYKNVIDGDVPLIDFLIKEVRRAEKRGINIGEEYEYMRWNTAVKLFKGGGK